MRKLIGMALLVPALVAPGCSGTSSNAGTDGGGVTGGGDGGGGGGKDGGGGNDGGGGGKDGGGAQDAAAPADFWDASNIPTANNVMVFKFLNRTNGKLTDAQLYWSPGKDSNEVHSFAEQPFYDIPVTQGRLYFYACPTGEASCTPSPANSKYADFLEHTIDASVYHGNTTRVDAFGLKLAMRLHCAAGADQTVGENYATFSEDRDATFARYVSSVPEAFKRFGQAPYAPYNIIDPRHAQFDEGTYYQPIVDAVWAANGITIPKPTTGPDDQTVLDKLPFLSAALYRHVGAVAGTFNADGTLANQKLWDDPATFYQTEPYNAYAKFWHDSSIDGKAYGFPYDDAGGYSTYIQCDNPRYMLVAVGW